MPAPHQQILLYPVSPPRHPPPLQVLERGPGGEARAPPHPPNPDPDKMPSPLQMLERGPGGDGPPPPHPPNPDADKTHPLSKCWRGGQGVRPVPPLTPHPNNRPTAASTRAPSSDSRSHVRSSRRAIVTVTRSRRSRSRASSRAAPVGCRLARRRDLPVQRLRPVVLRNGQLPQLLLQVPCPELAFSSSAE